MKFVRRLIACLRELRRQREGGPAVDEHHARLAASLDSLTESADRERDAMERVTRARDRATVSTREVGEVVDEMIRELNE